MLSRKLAAAGLAAALQMISLRPGALRAYSTIYSIGIEWDMAGDSDHDATAEVEYRVSGSEKWERALPLVRVDNTGYNMLAGSILFLRPNTTYQVKLNLADPDGGAETRSVAVTTRPLPRLPTGGRTFHVAPGSGGGDGSAGNRFRGIAAAQAVARPGDIFLVHAGSYGGRIAFTKPGTAGNYIVWKGAGDGEARFSGIAIAASHIWLEGLTVRDQADGLLTHGAPQGVVVTRCTFVSNSNSITLNGGGANWYLADNDIEGSTAPASESFSGEGIDLRDTGGHTIAHNRITLVADPISSPLTNTDIFGNDIFDTSDDGIEADTYEPNPNVRIWGNRIHNVGHNGISFQPQNGAPWYIIRNQIVSWREGVFKFRYATDRAVILHNTFVNWSGMFNCCNDDRLLSMIVKNNLWISATSGEMWRFGGARKSWRTDIDYNGFDWGGASFPFSYGGASYESGTSFAAASGLEIHGTRISKGTCFERFDVPGPPPTSIPPQLMTLKAGCGALDAGTTLPNINDDFVGAAPDLGAYEHGQPLPQYGPRPVESAGVPSTPTNLRVIR